MTTAQPITFCPIVSMLLDAEVPAQDGQHLLAPKDPLLKPMLDRAVDRYDRHGCSRCRRKHRASAPFHLVRSVAGPRIVCPECLRSSDRVIHVGATILDFDYGVHFDRIRFTVHGNSVGVIRPAFHLEVRCLYEKSRYAAARFEGRSDATPPIDPKSNAICTTQVTPGLRLRMPVHVPGMQLTPDERRNIFAVAQIWVDSSRAANLDGRMSAAHEQQFFDLAPFADDIMAEHGTQHRLADIGVAAFEADGRRRDA
jgi:hypothetical protein